MIHVSINDDIFSMTNDAVGNTEVDKQNSECAMMEHQTFITVLTHSDVFLFTVRVFF